MRFSFRPDNAGSRAGKIVVGRLGESGGLGAAVQSGRVALSRTQVPGLPAELIPPGAGNRLREAYRNPATANTSLFFDAAKVLKSLADHRLPVIALKGLSLAKNIYGDIALRPMSDIDLLLNEEDLVVAGRILLALGYQHDFPDWESMAKIYHHLPPFKNDNGTMIELHWNIVPPDSPITSRSRRVVGEIVSYRDGSPGGPDFFSGGSIPACVHPCVSSSADRIGFDPLLRFGRIDQIIRRSHRLAVVLERAARWGGQKCVYLMLLLVRELMGAAPPDRYMRKLSPRITRPFFLMKPWNRSLM